MDGYYIVKIALAIVGFLSTGGIIGWITKEKYAEKHEVASIRTENSGADKNEILNAKELVSMYKNALSDMQSQSDKIISEYVSRIKDYESKLKDYEAKLAEYINQVRLQSTTIDTLTKNQIKLKMQVMAIQSQSLTECEQCSFITNCEKYKAKKLIANESSNE